MNFKFAAVAAAVAATLALAACGGGGNDGNGFAPIGGIPSVPAPAPAPEPVPEPEPAPEPAPAVSTFMYEQVPYPVDTAGFLNDLDTEGAKGFMFLSALTAPASGTGANVYVKTGDTTYVYETKGEPADTAAFLLQANEAGGRGYHWVGADSVNGVSVMLYRKDSNTSATYSYRTDAAATNKTDFIAGSNAQGADGYFNVSPFFLFGGANVAIFEKSSDAGSTFSYEVKDDAADTNGALAQFEEAGARGFRFRGPAMFGNIFVKDLSQSTTFTFQAVPGQSTLEADIEKSNAMGAEGFAFVGPLVVGGENRTYYYKASNCTGRVLCMPTGPFGL
ncbi:MULTISPECIES: hypothetical protein [unclassified Variovorax]|uniref:hypothetical protein n=1 Tax=unclassified Variovorax TaxID=663243 RepID=UPI0008AE6346|nr:MULTISPECIES: hypothetical protein [unclassified Variovorax]SEK15543.1 hypothetical protein SAMN05518853_11829 [Variovorax sp. OK202]SFE16949.1 hypothetical protein SAMN05444746_11829 [Variovorax sp. OK212]